MKLVPAFIFLSHFLASALRLEERHAIRNEREDSENVRVQSRPAFSQEVPFVDMNHGELMQHLTAACHVPFLPQGLEVRPPEVLSIACFMCPESIAFLQSPKQVHNAHVVEHATCDVIQSLHNLIRDGLRYDNFGLDFEKVDETRYGTVRNKTHNLLFDDDVHRVWRLFYESSPQIDLQRERRKQMHGPWVHHIGDPDYPLHFPLLEIARQQFKFDYPTFAFRSFHYPDWLDRRAKDIAQSLRERGFAKIDDFGFDIQALQALRADHEIAMQEFINQTDAGGNETRRQMKQHVTNTRTGSWFSSTKLSTLDNIQNTKKWVFDGAVQYLGQDAVYTGHTAHRLVKGFRTDNTKTTYWHHDGCGNHLKVWILLQDTDGDGHPTQMAAGSHRTRKFFDTMWFPKKNLIHGAYEIASMTGSAGGGFVMDGNTFHRVKHAGRPMERNAVQIQIDPRAGLGQRMINICPDILAMNEEFIEVPFNS